MFYPWVLRAKERGWGSEGWEMGHGIDIAGVRNIKLQDGNGFISERNAGPFSAWLRTYVPINLYIYIFVYIYILYPDPHTLCTAIFMQAGVCRCCGSVLFPPIVLIWFC